MAIPKIIPQLKPITPLELYLQQVKGTYDSIRTRRKNMSYIPAQFGGIFGQSSLLKEGLVLELTDFEVQ